MAKSASQGNERGRVSYPGDVHVTYRHKPAGWPRGVQWRGWTISIVTFGDVDTLAGYTKQAMARLVARDLAKKRRVELTEHSKRTGQIIRKTSYGNDSRKVKG